MQTSIHPTPGISTSNLDRVKYLSRMYSWLGPPHLLSLAPMYSNNLGSLYCNFTTERTSAYKWMFKPVFFKDQLYFTMYMVFRKSPETFHGSYEAKSKLKTFGNKHFTSCRANLWFLNPSLYCQPVPTSRSMSPALPDPAQKANPPQILQTPF